MSNCIFTCSIITISAMLCFYRSIILIDSIATIPPRTTSTWSNFLVKSAIRSLFLPSVLTQNKKDDKMKWKKFLDKKGG